MTTDELNQHILGKFGPPPKRKRTNWRKELKAERNRVLDEAIVEIRRKMRDVPESWKRGYYSAITTLELMRD